MEQKNIAPRKVCIGSMVIIFGYLKNHIKLKTIYDTILLDNQGEILV